MNRSKFLIANCFRKAGENLENTGDEEITVQTVIINKLDGVSRGIMNNFSTTISMWSTTRKRADIDRIQAFCHL